VIAEPRRTRFLYILAVPVLIAVYVALKVRLGADLVDDAYIFLRYAANFANGQGLVFNPGERVEGYTSPLWVLTLALLRILHLDLVALLPTLSALAGVATILVLFLFAGDHLPRGREALIVLAAFFLVTNPSFLVWTWSGMDTALFTCLFVLSVLLFLRQAHGPGPMVAAGVVFALAALARLDILATAPLYLIFLLWLYRRQRRLLIRKLLSFLLPQLLLGLHFLWRFSYYGAWLPNTYRAKADIPLPALLASGSQYSADFAWAYALPLAILLLAVATVLSRTRQWPRPNECFLLALLVVWAAYVTYIGGDHFALYRFYVPILPLLALLSVSFADRLLAAYPGGTAKRLAGLAGGLIMLFALGNYIVYRFHGASSAAEEVFLARSWATVGQWLGRTLPPTTTLATVAVGAIPYYSGLRTYDMLGLTDRVVATQGKIQVPAMIGHQKYDTDYILAQRPDYIIYETSGIATSPQYQNPELIDQLYAYALYDLANDPRTKPLYEYVALRMDNDTYIEGLHLRQAP